jgi:hypothetical protein
MGKKSVTKRKAKTQCKAGLAKGRIQMKGNFKEPTDEFALE